MPSGSKCLCICCLIDFHLSEIRKADNVRGAVGSIVLTHASGYIPKDMTITHNLQHGISWLFPLDEVHDVGFVYLASSMFAPGVPIVMSEFHSDSETLSTVVVSIFVLSSAVGPLALAPLSEVYRRVIVFNVCNVLFTALTIGCALSTSLEMLVALRFLAGVAGVAVVTCRSGTIADMILREQRGRVMSL